MAYRRFAEDFEKISSVTDSTKFLVQGEDGQTKYATKEQIISGLPTEEELEYLTESISALSDAVESMNGLVEDCVNRVEGMEDDIASLNTHIEDIRNSAIFEAVYVREQNKINFLNDDGQIVAIIDTTDFIVDGMVDDVKIESGNLVITFNTDAGKEDISIPLTDIFDPNNYYDKTQIDNKLADKADKADTPTNDEVIAMIADAVEGKADSSEVYTKSEADDKFYIKDDDLWGGQWDMLIDQYDAHINDDILPDYTYNKQFIDSQLSRNINYKMIEDEVLTDIPNSNLLTAVKTQFYNVESGVWSLNYAQEQTALHQFLTAVFGSDIPNHETRILLSSAVITDPFVFANEVKIVPMSTVSGYYSIWFGALSKTYKWVRWDVRWDSNGVTILRLGYYTQELSLYFPSDPRMTGGEDSDANATGLYGMAKNINTSYALDNTELTQALLFYALQFMQSPYPDRSTPPSQNHDVLEILTEIGNSFVRPRHVHIGFASRGNSTGVYYVRARWTQIFKGSGAQGGGNLVVNDVDAVYRVELQASTIMCKYGNISTLIND